jgi:tRNA(Ile)-lysidine synthase
MLEQIDSKAFETLSSICLRTERLLPDFRNAIESELQDVVEDELFISIAKLEESKFPFTLLNEALVNCGFSSAQLFEIFELRNSNSGSMMESKTHKVFKWRDYLILDAKSKKTKKPMLMYEVFERYEISSLNTKSNVALFDADLVDMDNMNLRKWKLGDKFKPLGMNNWKLLSDFFIDQKLSVPEKEQVWLLLQDDEIVWVLNHRIDNRFKVQPTTQKVLKVTASN